MKSERKLGGRGDDTPVNPVLGRQRQNYYKFWTSLGCNNKVMSQKDGGDVMDNIQIFHCFYCLSFRQLLTVQPRKLFLQFSSLANIKIVTAPCHTHTHTLGFNMLPHAKLLLQ